MGIIKKRIADMERAAYNPRADLRPGDAEYERLRRSILQFGYVLPVVWNRRTNRVVGGHQRLTVLENEGTQEVEVSVVDLDEQQEKQLNVALNKISGEWDDAKLKESLDSLADRATETGFTEPEIDALATRIDDMLDNDFLAGELARIEETFNISLQFDRESRAAVESWVKERGKDEVVSLIMQAVRGER